MLTFLNVPRIRVLPQMGWIPDPFDPNDWYLDSTSVADAPSVVDDVDLSVFFRPVSDQMQFPSCTANAVVDAWEAACALDKMGRGWVLSEAVSSTPDLSRMFAWWNGRREMPTDKSGDPTSGCYLRLVVDSVARFGLPTEERWPYTLENASHRPSLMAYREAIPNRCSAFYTISAEGSARNTLILKALAARHSVVFGARVGKILNSYTGGVIQAPSSVGDGGKHAMVIVGWSKAKRAFKVRNSWSEWWGEGGYCWLHEDYIASPYVQSLWVITKGVL